MTPHTQIVRSSSSFVNACFCSFRSLVVFSLLVFYILRMYDCDCEQYYGLRHFIVRLSRALSSAEGLLFYLPYPLASSSFRLEISCTLIAATYLLAMLFLSYLRRNGLHCARCFHFCRPACARDFEFADSFWTV